MNTERLGQTISAWVPIGCCEPEDGERVLISLKYDKGFENGTPKVEGKIVIGYHYKSEGWYICDGDEYKANPYVIMTAWAELPEAYEGEQ